MKLRINLLFLAETTNRGGEIIAECTVDGVTLRTAQPGDALISSENVYLWPDRKGMLEFSDVDDVSQTLRIELFERVRPNEDESIGFCVLSRNSGFEVAPLQRGQNDEEGDGLLAIAGFEVRWVEDDHSTVAASSSMTLVTNDPVSNFCVSVSLCATPKSGQGLDRANAGTGATSGERFWFSYTYLSCEVSTLKFFSSTEPRFSPLKDIFQLRAASKAMLEMLDTSPLVVCLNSTHRGVIGIAALSFRHQSSRSIDYLWQRSSEDELGPITAQILLSNDSPSIFISSLAHDNQSSEVPPPPPPHPDNSTSTALVQSKNSNKSPSSDETFGAIAAKQHQFESAIGQTEALQQELTELAIKLDSRERKLKRREEELEHKARMDAESARSEILKIKGEFQIKTRVLEGDNRHLKSELDRLLAEKKRLEQENEILKRRNDELTAKFAHNHVGELTQALAREKGLNEAAQAEIAKLNDRLFKYESSAGQSFSLVNMRNDLPSTTSTSGVFGHRTSGGIVPSARTHSNNLSRSGRPESVRSNLIPSMRQTGGKKPGELPNPAEARNIGTRGRANPAENVTENARSYAIETAEPVLTRSDFYVRSADDIRAKIKKFEAALHRKPSPSQVNVLQAEISRLRGQLES